MSLVMVLCILAPLTRSITERQAEIGTISLMAGRLSEEGHWKSKFGQKLANFFEKQEGQATFRFTERKLQVDNEQSVVEVTLRDPTYIDQNVIIIKIPISKELYQIDEQNQTNERWEGSNAVEILLKYKRKDKARLEYFCSYIVNRTFLGLTCPNSTINLEIVRHEPTQYKLLPWGLLIPPYILFIASRKILIDNVQLQSLSTVSTFFSLNLVLFVALLEVGMGLIHLESNDLKLLVITGLLTFFSVKFCQAVLIDRYYRPRQHMWYSILTLVYLNLLEDLATQNWFILLQSLVFLPQIIHNILKLSKATFNIGHITCLLSGHIFLLYYEGYPYNIMTNSPNYPLCLIMVMLVTAQILFIYLQSVRGSRFFMPKWMKFNYHDYSEQIQVTEDNKNQIGQCSICLMSLTESVEEQMVTESTINASKNVTVAKTPCKHRYHFECLSKWLNNKMECPVCRNKLPPIE